MKEPRALGVGVGRGAGHPLSAHSVARGRAGTTEHMLRLLSNPL